MSNGTDKKINKIKDRFEIYKVNRRKNNLIIHCLNGKLYLNFKSITYAKKYKKIIKQNLK